VPSDTAEPTPTPTAEPPPTPAAASLRLATWNVSRLDLPDQGDNPRTAADLALMATYADRLAADVVALQEVRGVAGTQTLFPAPAWSAECENRNSGQNVCVVLREDSGWSMTRNADVTALNASDPNLRQGLDLTLSRPGQEPLRVLAIHLRFGCLSGDTNAACPGWVDQLAIVEDWIDARAAAGEAFVVLGDWNRFLTADDTAWAAIDDDDPAGASLTRSIPQGTPTPCWSAVFTEFLDHIVLGQSAATWMSASEQIAYDETDFDTYSVLLSDHCPIWADLEVPAATR
jgi:endonuclease/exonuclease/phosphatase family metal-dependent hydrolase